MVQRFAKTKFLINKLCHSIQIQQKKAGKKSKHGPAKKEGLSIKEKMELLYEKVLDDLLVNQDKLTKTERVKVFVTLSNYIFPKTKPARDQFTIKQLKEIEK